MDLCCCRSFSRLTVTTVILSSDILRNESKRSKVFNTTAIRGLASPNGTQLICRPSSSRLGPQSRSIQIIMKVKVIIKEYNNDIIGLTLVPSFAEVTERRSTVGMRAFCDLSGSRDAKGIAVRKSTWTYRRNIKRESKLTSVALFSSLTDRITYYLVGMLGLIFFEERLL